MRLVDCPGLVLPNLIPMEHQVLASVLPIAQMPSVPSCISYVSELMPLEDIFKLQHPRHSEEKVTDKRTWREGTGPKVADDKPSPPKWTAMDIMVAYAIKNGWVTAQAGRPDVHRAGNSSEC